MAVGSAAVFPFEMDTVVSLADNKLVGTHYGFYNTIVGIGILGGNLATGSVMQATREQGYPELVWSCWQASGCYRPLRSTASIEAAACNRSSRQSTSQRHNRSSRITFAATRPIADIRDRHDYQATPSMESVSASVGGCRSYPRAGGGIATHLRHDAGPASAHGRFHG